MVFVSLCCALFLIKLSWDFYSSNPTQTVIETTHHGIWNYPFPAITVCNINRVSYKLAKKFIDSMWVFFDIWFVDIEVCLYGIQVMCGRPHLWFFIWSSFRTQSSNSTFSLLCFQLLVYCSLFLSFSLEVSAASFLLFAEKYRPISRGNFCWKKYGWWPRW